MGLLLYSVLEYPKIAYTIRPTRILHWEEARPVGSIHSSKYKRFLKRLRAARQEAGFTQVQVSKALGQTQSFVSKCESGERRVDAVELEAFANLYKKPLSYFLPEKGNGT